MDYKEKTYNTILLGLEDGVLTLTNNLPEQRNALTLEWMYEIRPVLDQLTVDPEVKVLVITGAGQAFSAGGNIKEFARPPKERTEHHPLSRPLWNVPTMTADQRMERQTMSGKKIFLGIANLGKPTLAAINGPAAGAGFDMALACDMRIMADDAQMISSFVNIGIVPIDGGLWWLSRMVGVTRAYEIMYLGQPQSGKRCEEIGLATKCVPADQLMPETMKIAKKLAKGPSISYQLIKYFMRKAMFWDLGQAFDEFYQAQEILFNSADNLEALNAILEKRKPTFKGM